MKKVITCNLWKHKLFIATNKHCNIVILTLDVLLVGWKTVLPSFEEFTQSLRINSVEEIEEKTDDCENQKDCSTPKALDSSDNFQISPLQASVELETDNGEEITSSTVTEKHWECKLVDYDTSKEDDCSVLDLNAKSTMSSHEHTHCIAERPSCQVYEERNIGTIEFVDEKNKNIDYSQIKVPVKLARSKMPKIVIQGPQILTKPLDKSQTAPSISDDHHDDGQKSFEDTCFSSYLKMTIWV